MSLCVARYGDVCGGPIFAGASTVLTNGLPTAQIYNSVAGHGDCPHCAPVTVGASGTVFEEGQPVHRFFRCLFVWSLHINRLTKRIRRRIICHCLIHNWNTSGCELPTLPLTPQQNEILQKVISGEFLRSP